MTRNEDGFNIRHPNPLAELKAMLNQMDQTPMKSMSEPERIAFHINHPGAIAVIGDFEIHPRRR